MQPNQILDFIKSYTNGISDVAIMEKFSDISPNQLSTELIKLELENRIKRDKNNRIFYVNNIEDEEKCILMHLGKSKNQGCTMRDLKFLTRLPQSLISKVLRKLVDNRTVKTLKGQKNKQKIYMLFDEAPDDEITGGIWFNNGDVDIEFVSQLGKLIYSFVKTRTESLIPFESNPTLEDIKMFIEETGALSIRISNNDLSKIIDVMVYGQVLQRLRSGNTVMYRTLHINENVFTL